jgi:hypothetical protein
MILNFYGSQKGLTEKQYNVITSKIKEIAKNQAIKEFRHCDSIGDVDIHEYVLINDLADNIVLYPPCNMEIRGFSAATNKVIIKEENTLSLNLKAMCDKADIMIIAPHETDHLETNGPCIAEELGKKMNVKQILTIRYDGSVIEWPDTKILKLRKRITEKKTDGKTDKNSSNKKNTK